MTPPFTFDIAISFGRAYPSIHGTVVRKNPHAFAFCFGPDGVRTKWPSPKKSVWI